EDVLMSAAEAEETAPHARVTLRTVIQGDLPFIASGWLRSNKRGLYKKLEPRLYYYWHHKMIAALIPVSTVIVACDVDDPDHIFGFVCAQYDAPPILTVHFVYVRDQWR